MKRSIALDASAVEGHVPVLVKRHRGSEVELENVKNTQKEGTVVAPYPLFECFSRFLVRPLNRIFSFQEQAHALFAPVSGSLPAPGTRSSGSERELDTVKNTPNPATQQRPRLLLPRPLCLCPPMTPLNLYVPRY